MSLYVLDTSVAVKWAIPEPDSLKALAFQDNIKNNIHEIIAPDVFAEEVAHVVPDCFTRLPVISPLRFTRSVSKAVIFRTEKHTWPRLRFLP